MRWVVQLFGIAPRPWPGPRWAVLLLLVCGGLAAGPSRGQAESAPPAAVWLRAHVLGVGQVGSVPPGIDCGRQCSRRFARGAAVELVAVAAPGQRFVGWDGACTGASACTVRADRDAQVSAVFAPLPTGRFGERPFLFKADEARLRASMAARDPEASGLGQNVPGQSLGFLTLARTAHENRAAYRDVPAWHLAMAGWLLEDTAMLQRARDEAMALVAAAPAGDSGRGEHFQHVEDRMLNIAAVADLAHAHFSAGQLEQVSAWVNGSLANWNRQNTSFWPMDEPLNNYWQNGFLAHVVGGIATEGFNTRAAAWRETAEVMARKWVQRTTVGWSGPVQSEGHYYSGYVHHAMWALELLDQALGTAWLQRARFVPADYLNLLMFQTRPHLVEFFEVGSEANAATAPHTFLSLSFWHHLISTGRHTPQARQAKAVLQHVMPRTNWPRWSKAFVNFYWGIQDVPRDPLAAKADRLYAAPAPGAGLVGVRSSEGFAPTARAALMFANHFGGGAAYSHSNPDAPGFQWGDGADWLVTDPEYFNRSGIIAEAGPTQLSNVSNMVTLAGVLQNSAGSQPRIVYAEDNTSSAAPHFYVQIDAQPYWSMASIYRRDYVWLDDLRVVVIWDRVVAPMAKRWRLHLPAAVTINGDVARCSVNGKTVTVRDVLATGEAPWAVESTLNVWRLSQDAAAGDYRSIKVLDVGERVSATAKTTGPGWHQVSLVVQGATRTVRFYDDGRHAQVE